jgi:hypothetical protein
MEGEGRPGKQVLVCGRPARALDGRRAHANGASAAERAGVRQEECGDIHRVGKSGLNVGGCSQSNLTFDFLLRKFVV